MNLFRSIGDIEQANIQPRHVEFLQQSNIAPVDYPHKFLKSIFYNRINLKQIFAL
ncbi:hypothetical protein [Pleurocapsa sp. CCALA 161]|uniref:hypothetical protein n=1 Tax=Pleurocapsa sp. CCALA 161 TaxID=2107688 RepID=UPI001304E500|nr:hypothetical protein [Pleurocapsa sp. CCALA 161]